LWAGVIGGVSTNTSIGIKMRFITDFFVDEYLIRNRLNPICAIDYSNANLHYFAKENTLAMNFAISQFATSLCDFDKSVIGF
jgi:hypothetical protein